VAPGHSDQRSSCFSGPLIAQSAEFFSFGTTQTTYGISRDDAASFLGTYVSRDVLPSDPFVSIDREGVGELMRKLAQISGDRPEFWSPRLFAVELRHRGLRSSGVMPRS
jgi:hypothetical protein